MSYNVLMNSECLQNDLMVYSNRCGSVPGEHQIDPRWPPGEVHWCWNYWQTGQLHPCHSLQTTGNTRLISWFCLPAPLWSNCIKHYCITFRGCCRWSYSWSCALWTSLTVCCWRASPRWLSCSNAFPVILETYFPRSAHSDLKGLELQTTL